MEIDAVSSGVKRVPRLLLVLMKRVAAQQRRGVCRGAYRFFSSAWWAVTSFRLLKEH